MRTLIQKNFPEWGILETELSRTKRLCFGVGRVITSHVSRTSQAMGSVRGIKSSLQRRGFLDDSTTMRGVTLKQTEAKVGLLAHMLVRCYDYSAGEKRNCVRRPEKTRPALGLGLWKQPWHIIGKLKYPRMPKRGAFVFKSRCDQRPLP